MSDIVERLRESAALWLAEIDTRREAADEIERLRNALKAAQLHAEIIEREARARIRRRL